MPCKPLFIRPCLSGVMLLAGLDRGVAEFDNQLTQLLLLLTGALASQHPVGRSGEGPQSNAQAAVQRPGAVAVKHHACRGTGRWGLALLVRTPGRGARGCEDPSLLLSLSEAWRPWGVGVSGQSAV